MITLAITTQILLIITVLYAWLEGIREAYFYHAIDWSKKVWPENEHIWFFLQRAFVWLAITSTWMFACGWTVIVAAIGLAGIFAYVHNGTYFVERHKLNSDIYHDGWDTDEPDDDDGTIDLTLRQRKLALYAGLLLMCVPIIIEIVWAN